jgi:hypothetical protein
MSACEPSASSRGVSCSREEERLDDGAEAEPLEAVAAAVGCNEDVEGAVELLADGEDVEASDDGAEVGEAPSAQSAEAPRAPRPLLRFERGTSVEDGFKADPVAAADWEAVEDNAIVGEGWLLEAVDAASST